MATMTFQRAQELAKWLATNQPDIFLALQKNAEARAQLAGITDLFSSIGTGLVNATKQVGSFLTSQQGLETLTGLTTAYVGYKGLQAQQDAIKLQTRLAEQNQPLAPVQQVRDPYTGQVVPYYYGQNAPPVPLTSQLAQKLAPAGGIPSWAPFAFVGGIGFVFLMAFMNRR